MKTERITIHGHEFTKIIADDGRQFRRLHDGFEMGEEIILGVDYSTGEPREDLPEYYQEIVQPNEEDNL